MAFCDGGDYLLSVAETDLCRGNCGYNVRSTQQLEHHNRLTRWWRPTYLDSVAISFERRIESVIWETSWGAKAKRVSLKKSLDGWSWNWRQMELWWVLRPLWPILLDMGLVYSLNTRGKSGHMAGRRLNMPPRACALSNTRNLAVESVQEERVKRWLTLKTNYSR